MIELWNIDRLKQRIKDGKLGESAKFGYLFIWLALFGWAGALVPITVDYEQDPLFLVYNIGWFLISAVGLYLMYRYNGGKNGHVFADKFFSIGFVVSIRLLPAWIVIMILMGSFETPPAIDVAADLYATTWLQITAGTVMSALWVWRTIVHIADVREVKEVK